MLYVMNLSEPRKIREIREIRATNKTKPLLPRSSRSGGRDREMANKKTDI